MKRLCFLWLVVGWAVPHVAFAWHVDGCGVFCDANANGEIDDEDAPLAGVTVIVTNTGGTFVGTATTGDDGCFYLELPDGPDSYTAELDASTLPADAVVVSPPGGVHEFTLTNENFAYVATWLVDSDVCQEGLCWMTGGGVKFEPVTDTWNATSDAGKGPRDSVGGVVHPACSGFPSEGGEWNHIAHSLKLHFHGKAISVVQCGNVDGIEPGSESPVTPFNFIEFEGTGTIVGLGGNKLPRTDVTFFGRVEDRNEPGNENANGADDGANIDRYFLRVANASSGNLMLLVDADGVDDGAVDPLTITGGNFQLHKCDPPGGAKSLRLPDYSTPADFVTYFLRGDSNIDGMVDVADSLFSLGALFLGGRELRCLDSADANDDGALDVTDAVHILMAIYTGRARIPAPYPGAGEDPTRDRLGCALYR